MAVVLRYKTISGPRAVLFVQDVENIGSPFTSPALSVLFCDISDQVRETALAATHAGEDCWMVHDSELFPVSTVIREFNAHPPPHPALSPTLGERGRVRGCRPV
jgi:hypothetical protein